MIDEISTLTHVSWGECYAYPITEFMNYVAYLKDKQKEEKRMIEQYKRR